MDVTFGTICLNEAQYLSANVHQHIALCDRWVIVEGADMNFPSEHVTDEGFSTDGTGDIITELTRKFSHVEHIRHGWAKDKSELRNRYAELAKDGVLIVFDADEFLRRSDLKWIIQALQETPEPACLRLPHVHFWKTDQQVITGGYYDIPHNRAYRWQQGSRYQDNHNHPHLPDGRAIHDCRLKRFERRFVKTISGGYTHYGACWYHYGFCKAPDMIKAKNAYYVNRGEATTRPGTTRDRAAWFQDDLSAFNILPWDGPWPEVFSEEPSHV